MSNAKRTPQERRQKYMVYALKLNPLESADEIITLRNRCFGVKSPDQAQITNTGPGYQEQRAHATKVIELVREKFWKIDLKVLRRKLAELKLDMFPDLQHAAYRLQITADHRQLMPALSQNARFDPDLFSALKKVLVSAPRDTANVKERFMQKLKNNGPRRRAQKMARLLEREMPELYELEQDWLDSIVHFKPRKVAIAQTSSSSDTTREESYGGYGCLYWFIIVAVLRIVRLMLAGGE